MKNSNCHRTTWFVSGLTAFTLGTSLLPGTAASPAGNPPAAATSTPSHEAMQQMPRLQPRRVVTVTGNEDWEALRGFGKDSAMTEMMTLMMVGGSGMEHMKMGSMKRGGMSMAGMNMGAPEKDSMSMSGVPRASANGGDMNMNASGAVNSSLGLLLAIKVTPNPPVVGNNTLDIAVTDASGKPVTGLNLATSVAMTSMDMGTTTPKVTEGQDGHYATVVNFAMNGPWRVLLTGSAPGNKAAAAIRAALDFNVGSPQKWGQERSSAVDADPKVGSSPARK